MSIVWSLLILGDKMQPRKDNHPGKTFEPNIANPEIDAGAGQFRNDFGNDAKAPIVTRKKTYNYLR
jgi:hypothetical protein